MSNAPRNVAYYSISKSIFREPLLKYRCPACRCKLKSPLCDAGKVDTCPACSDDFVTPGQREVAGCDEPVREPPEHRQAAGHQTSSSQGVITEPPNVQEEKILSTTSGVSDARDSRWYYRLMGETIGPLSYTQLLQHSRSSQLKPDMYVRRHGSQDWIAALEVDGLFVDTRFSPTSLPPTGVERIATDDLLEQLSEASPNRQPGMAKYMIAGVRSSDGVECKIILDAGSEAEALVKSKNNGVYPTKVKVLPASIPASTKRVPSRAFRAVEDVNPRPDDVKPHPNEIRALGYVLMVAGIACVIIFGLFYDTTVTTGTGGFGMPSSSQTVYNIGKQQNRLLGFIGGISSTGIGILLLALDANQVRPKKGSHPNGSS